MRGGHLDCNKVVTRRLVSIDIFLNFLRIINHVGAGRPSSDPKGSQATILGSDYRDKRLSLAVQALYSSLSRELRMSTRGLPIQCKALLQRAIGCDTPVKPASGQPNQGR